jgi:hypothetical protein
MRKSNNHVKNARAPKRIAKLALLLAAGLVMSALFGLVHHVHPLYLGKELYEAGRCALLQSAARAHYDLKLHKTVDAHFCRAPAVLDVQGDRVSPLGLAVLSDLGHELHRFDAAGRLRWVRHFSLQRPTGLAAGGGHLYVSMLNKVKVMNAQDGREIAELSFSKPVMGLSVSGNLMTLSYRIPGPRSVEVFKVARDFSGVRSVFVNPHRGVYPRDARLLGRLLIVSDTFGQRVYAVDTGDAAIRWQYKANYPYGVSLQGHKLLVSEEHANHISAFDLSSGVKSIVFGCPRYPFDDPAVAPEQVDGVATETFASLRPHDAHPCRMRNAMDVTLYSQGGIDVAGDALLVADTDNHRVVEFGASDPRWVAVGFNNPVMAVYVR